MTDWSVKEEDVSAARKRERRCDGSRRDKMTCANPAGMCASGVRRWVADSDLLAMLDEEIAALAETLRAGVVLAEMESGGISLQQMCFGEQCGVKE